MIRSWLIILLLGASANAYADIFEPGKLTNPVACRADAGQTYAVYIPVKGNKEALPIIYMFDPHGDGSLPLKKYKTLADAYGFILVGSNNSKNGNDWNIAENIWRNLSEDTKARLKIDERRIYTCGFSGGAKVAGYIAIQHAGIKGVIAGGAGLPDGVSASDFNFSFTAIAGEGDMNLTDMIAINNELDRTRTRHRIIIFDGKHEWASLQAMNGAFAGLQFDAMRGSLIPKTPAFISAYVTNSKARVDSYVKSNQLIKAVQECDLSIRLLDGLSNDAGWFKQKTASLASNTLYQQQRKTAETLLVKEQNIKEGYMQHFQQENMGYWTSTIDDLKEKAVVQSVEKGMYQRLLAYLSLAFYSLSNRMINGNDNRSARYFVALYKMADPTNSEAWYFSAVLHARDRDTRAAEADLDKAVENGFRDEVRLTLQPEFRSIDLTMIKNKIRPH